MRAWTLGSGSRGNAIIVESGDRRVLIDCGFGPRTLVMRMRSLGIAPESIEAVLITHEHQDHAQGLERAQHKWRWPVHGAPATLAALRVPARWRHEMVAGEESEVGGFRVEGIDVPHDAASPMAYVLTASASGARLGVAHDLGRVPDPIRRRFMHCDALCVESNHDVDMLRDGPYPAMLKARIRGGRGHLGNEACGELVAGLAHGALQAVVLLHLSETNNTPELAERTVGALARRGGYRGPVVAAPGRTPAEAFTLGARRVTSPRPFIPPPSRAATSLVTQLELAI
jgi:phosphoribosyl 1,2-cyclic phosphodiesterase